MFRSNIKNSQVNNNNNIVIDSGNINIENALVENTVTENASIENTLVENTLNIDRMVLNGVQDGDLHSLQQPLTEIENNVREISQKLEENKRFEILKWLSKVDYKEHHRFISSARQPNTGDWLLRKHDFIQWNKSSSSILWLHGIAGAGKTMLASLVIDIPRPKNHAVAYFYCNYGEIDRQGPQSVLTTIVKQLSLMVPEGFLPKAVISIYEEQKEDGVESRRLSLDQSTELILQLSRAFSQTVIIVDALDECPKETRYQLLVALMKLRTSTDGLKIFITSRNDDDIRFELENESEVYIQSSDNSSDIQLFVEAEIEKYISTKRLLSGNVRPELKQAIIDTLIKEADGMFLWVHLQIEHIRKEKSETAIRKALQRLPKDLAATYLVIWGKILGDTDENRILAQRTLKWIICAKRPLTVKEIIEAASTTPMQWTEKPDDGSVTHTILLDVCRNLVVLDKELGVLRTAHFSVTEFLLKTISSSGAHTAASEVCLTLLCYENHLSASCQTDIHILDHYALCDYVMKYWAEHIRLSGDGSRTLTELQKMFFEPSLAYSKWLLLANSRYKFYNGYIDDSWYFGNSDLVWNPEEKEVNPLWVACYFQLWDIFKYLLGSSPDCTTRNSVGMMPIHLIAKYGYAAGVKLLLEQKGVRLNATTDEGEIPLHVAASNGHQLVALQLLGINPDAGTGGGRTAGDSVVRDRAMSILRKVLLEQNGVHLNAKDKYGRAPLCAAARRGHDAVVRLLLEQKGVLVNAKDKDGNTSLHDAALNGHEAVVMLLLEQKAVLVNAKDDDGCTPLHDAARKGHEAIVRLMLEHKDILVNAKSRNGGTPLHLSARYGHQAVVRLLLEQKGVLVNAKIMRGKTPLHEAARSGREAVVRLLLEQKSVDLNAKNNDGETPRDLAARRRRVALVKLIDEVTIAREGNTRGRE